MPIIPRHHANDPYKPLSQWPDHVAVQWGGGGLVIRKDGSGYTTAFFEVFPNDNAGGFIHGEGATIALAETVAFRKWNRQVACSHRWCRRGYTNGGGICAICGAFQGQRFKPIVKLGDWRQPLTPNEEWLLLNGDLPESEALRHKLGLRKTLYGVGPRGQATGMEALFERCLPDTKED